MPNSRFFHFALLALGVFVFSSCDMGSPNKEQVYEIIDQYFAEKGDDQIEAAIERIIERKRRGPSLDEMLARRVNVDISGAATKGPADAPITIVEFSDFQCGYCQAVQPSIQKVFADNPGKIRLAFRHNSLPRHAAGNIMHFASLAAQEQGKFWEFHDLVFEKQQEWARLNPEGESSAVHKKASEYAKSIGLDVAQFEADMKNNREAYEARIAADSNFARQNGAGGTPSFFINGALIVGLRPPEFFQEVVDKLLAEKS